MRGNKAEYETLQARATDRLRTVLPAGWVVTLSQGTADHREVDGVLTVRNGSGRTARYSVELRLTTPSNSGVINQLLAMRQATELPVILVAEYVNPALRAACQDHGFSYLDTTGWAHIVHEDPPLLIRLEGAQRPPRPRGNQATTRLSGPAAGRAIRTLLETTPPIGVRELAQLANSSPAAVSKLMPALTMAGAVERDEAGAVVRIRRRSLLKRWTTDYRFTGTNGVTFDYLAPRGLTNLLTKLNGRDDVCVTGSPAARHYLPASATSVIPMLLAPLYTADPQSLADQLKLARTGRESSNVIITTPRDKTLLTAHEYTGTGLPVAPLGQVLADLLTLPGRFAQEADQLVDHLSRADPSWSE